MQECRIAGGKPFPRDASATYGSPVQIVDADEQQAADRIRWTKQMEQYTTDFRGDSVQLSHATCQSYRPPRLWDDSVLCHLVPENDSLPRSGQPRKSKAAVGGELSGEYIVVCVGKES